jgi:hypothetical protein
MTCKINSHILVPYKMCAKILQAFGDDMAPFPKSMLGFPLFAVKYLELCSI